MDQIRTKDDLNLLDEDSDIQKMKKNVKRKDKRDLQDCHKKQGFLTPE